jgi:hypothetical protein
VAPRSLAQLRSLRLKSLDISYVAVDDEEIGALVAGHGQEWGEEEGQGPAGLLANIETALEGSPGEKSSTYSPEAESEIRILKEHLRQLAQLHKKEMVREHASPPMQSLNLVSCMEITDRSLFFLSRYQNLTRLNLNFCQNISDLGISQLTTLTNLKKLSLSCCVNIKNASLSSINKLGKLEALYLASCKITDVGLAHLRPAVTLKELDLSFCTITDKGLHELEALTRLESLKLKQCHVTTPAVKDLVRRYLTNLSEIQF